MQCYETGNLETVIVVMTPFATIGLILLVAGALIFAMRSRVWHDRFHRRIDDRYWCSGCERVREERKSRR